MVPPINDLCNAARLSFPQKPCESNFGQLANPNKKVVWHNPTICKHSYYKAKGRALRYFTHNGKRPLAMRKSKIGQVVQTTRGAGIVDIHVGGRIRALRNLKEMSQNELGEALGVSFQQVQKYEKGMNRVGAGRLLQIAATLGCEAADLLENAPTNGKPVKPFDRDGALSVTALDDLAKNHVGIRLVKAYLGLPPKLRVALTEMAERLATT